MKKKILCFDLDNTLCKTIGNDYQKAKPLKKKILFVNSLKKKYYIKIFTSRFMGRSNENNLLASKKGYEFTRKQLLLWKLKYDELIFGKPSYDLLVDDKSLNFNQNWIKILKKKLLNK